MAECRLTALLVYLFVLTGGSQGFTVVTDKSNLDVAIGGDAEFTVRPSSAIGGGNWDFKSKAIVQWLQTILVIHPEYTSRAVFNTTTGSLTLKSVNESDNGDYTVSLTEVGTGTKASTTITLKALEPVSTPNITSNASSFIEHNDTVVLTCVADGTDVSYTWRNDSSVISNGGRLELSAYNTTLTITGVLRSDGPFTCRASNAVSAETSEPFLLIVFYGPDNPTIVRDPNTTVYTSGTNVTLTCSAESNPAAVLSWYRNGEFVHYGDQLNITNVSNKDNGSYACVAFNNETGRYISSPLYIDVLERVANVSLRSNNPEPVEQRDSVVLTCNSRGTQVKWEWLFNKTTIQSNDRVNISGNTLIIDPVNRTDAGVYKCTVSNGVNNGSAETTLVVYYGPDNMEITQSPVTITNGENLTLTCSAQSVPIPVYEWFNGAERLSTGPVFTISPVSMEHAVNYTCRAYNARTGINISLTVNVDVGSVIIVLYGGLGPGAIAGIVCGAVLAAILLCVSIWYFRKKYMNRSKSGTPSNDPKMSSSGNIPVTQTEYAAIERKKPAPQQLEQSNNGTSAAPAQARGVDVIYMRPQIIGPGANPSGEIVSDIRTDYAELKYR